VRQGPADTATAIQDLAKAIETLEKRQAHLEKQMDRQVEDAKQKLAKKDKKGAMFALKKKKMLGTQVDSILGTMITMEQQKMALENAATNRLAVDAIGGANAAIGTAMGGYDVEKVGEKNDPPRLNLCLNASAYFSLLSTLSLPRRWKRSWTRFKKVFRTLRR